MDTMANFLAGIYTAFSPAFKAAAAICTVNGQQIACPQVSGVFYLFPVVFWAMIIIIIIANWKIFTKAGQPGWASIVPVYNIVVMLQIVKKPIWWILLFLIPFVNIVIGIIVANKLAKSFGKGIGFTIGLIFLPFIFYPILGFGKAVYMPTEAAPTSTAQI